MAMKNKDYRRVKPKKIHVKVENVGGLLVKVGRFLVR